jgi:hypothetical protein
VTSRSPPHLRSTVGHSAGSHTAHHRLVPAGTTPEQFPCTAPESISICW